MKAFIWKVAERLTEAWHDGGGLLVVAEDLEKARVQFLATAPPSQYAYENGARSDQLHPQSVLVLQPDLVLELVDGSPDVVIFPGAGCC